MLTPADSPLTAAFDAVSTQLRAALGSGDTAAIVRLRAALDALLSPLVGR